MSKNAKVRDVQILQDIRLHLEIIQSIFLYPRGGFLALQADKTEEDHKIFKKTWKKASFINQKLAKI